MQTRAPAKPPVTDGIPDLISRFKSRKLALITDDFVIPPRGTIVAAAENISPETVNEALTLSRGLTFVALGSERTRAFMLSPMPSGVPPVAEQNTLSPHVKFTESAAAQSQLMMCESVEAREGVTTGISAADRAKTISLLGEKNPVARKLVKPGHIFPLQVKDGGVLVRNALPEAAHDLAVLSGFTDAALFMDILDRDGNFASQEDLSTISSRHRIPLFALSQLIRYRLEHEHLVKRVAEAKLPTRLCGEMRSILYRSFVHEGEHVALVKGRIEGASPVLTRVHTENTLGDVFGGDYPPSRKNIDGALNLIGAQGAGVFLYLRKSVLDDTGLVSSGAEKQFSSEAFTLSKARESSMMREYGIGAQILRDLGITRVNLITGSKKNLVGLHSFGIEIVSQQEIPQS